MNTTAILQSTQSENMHSTFYPTPKPLIDKLLEGIDLQYVDSILEPSAGKGDIARGIIYKEHRIYDEVDFKRWQRRMDIDCIEIDPFLRSYLDGEGFRVVHDDFLTYETQKRYDLIVMNPPFDKGAEHLIHALELIENGGEVRCILNAETIKNPYSAIRQRLLSMLGDDADITFEDNAFMEAERVTDVQIAIIKKKVPKKQIDSTIMEDMRKAPTYKTKPISSEYEEIVRYNEIDKWVNQYDYEVACGIGLIEEYYAMRSMIGNSFIKLDIDTSGDDETSHGVINSYVREVRKKYWSTIFQQKTFTDKLTSNLQSELHNSVNELMDYDFSSFNILTLLLKMNQRVVKGIEETIINLFDDWTRNSWHEDSPNRHYYNGWKTNDCFAIGKKVIIPFYGAYDSWSNKFRSWNVAGKFRDIEKVFDFLDSGRTDWGGSLEIALQVAETSENTRNIDTKYFTATFYKKGTAHLVFKDEELLEKFNLFAGQNKNWLPPCYGKKQYKDMDAEEQAVVDSFQGRERYEHIMAHADYYLNTASQQPLLLGA